MIFIFWQTIKRTLTAAIHLLFILFLFSAGFFWNEVSAQVWKKPYAWTQPNGCSTHFELLWPRKVVEIVPFESEESLTLSPRQLQYDFLNAVFCSEEPPAVAIEKLPEGIRVTERDLQSEFGDAVIGKARWYWRGDEIIEGDIWIKSSLSLWQILSAQAHELGHIIGLADHSDDRNDLMYHAAITSQLNVGDLKRISKLYFSNAVTPNQDGDFFIPCLSMFQISGEREKASAIVEVDGAPGNWEIEEVILGVADCD